MGRGDLLVEVSAGPVRGQERNGVCVFLGLPFAAPPVGPLTFRSPKPVTPCSEVRDPSTPGPSAPQVLSGGSAWIYENDGNPSEDCLYLNVWTPDLTGGRPVMVWFHGGAFRTGHAALPCFDGSRLALDGDVVVVTCNYRLGGLGWLAHPGLADPDSGSWANWGLQDQIAALAWLQENVAAFGGDPENVTLFGESAGANSILHIARNPKNSGLLSQLIAQSSARRHRYAADPDLSVEYAEALARINASYVYEFAHPSPIAGVRSPHTLEIPFVFGTFDGPFMAPRAGAGASEASLSAVMREAWTSFAHSSRPAARGASSWLPYDAALRPVMVFGGMDGQAALIHSPREATRALWDRVLAA